MDNATPGYDSKETKKVAPQVVNNNKSNQLICCNVYISESRNKTILDKIENAVIMNQSNPNDTVIVNKFIDIPYNRVNYTLVSYITHGNPIPIYSPIQKTLLTIAKTAYQSINLKLHTGTHPRLGVIDDIIFHPLGSSSMEETTWVANSVAKEMGDTLQIPIYLYDRAHPFKKPASLIRRQLGYFRPNNPDYHQWSGFTHLDNNEITITPDEGPTCVVPSRGICMIGAGPWVRHYNIPVLSTDIVIVRRIAKMVSGRGGGLDSVQTIGLVHAEGLTEIACMLLQPELVGADGVQTMVEMLAEEAGLYVHKGYFTDYSPDMIVHKYWTLVNGLY